jgi:hypothetical protein
MNQDTSEIPRKTMLVFNIFIYLQRRVLKDRYGKRKTDAWLKRSKEMFKSLYLKIPDIGGKENIMYPNIVLATFFMPMVMIMKGKSIPTREIGEFIYRLAERACYAIPFPLRFLKRRSYFNEVDIEKMRLAAEKSLLLRFPADWVFKFVKGGEKYLFGYDMRECGIHKFWTSQGLEEFVPYLCLTDWVKWKSIGISIERTKTIANGHEVCDFRYCRQKKECPSGWPPESNIEWTGKFERGK